MKEGFEIMKVYLVPTRDVYIQRSGALKAKEVIPFLKRALSMQRNIFGNKKSRLHLTVGK